MSTYILSAMLLVIGIIHLLPVSGVVSADRLAALYGVAVSEPNLELLLRHRAVLFGLLGGVFVCSAFVPTYQALALVLSLVSILAFLWLALTVGGQGDGLASLSVEVRRVVAVDLVALVCWVVAAGIYLSQLAR